MDIAVLKIISIQFTMDLYVHSIFLFFLPGGYAQDTGASGGLSAVPGLLLQLALRRLVNLR